MKNEIGVDQVVAAIALVGSGRKSAFAPIREAVETPLGIRSIVGVAYAHSLSDGTVVSGRLTACPEGQDDADTIQDSMIASVVRFVMDGHGAPEAKEVVVSPRDGVAIVQSGNYTEPAEDVARKNQASSTSGQPAADVPPDGKRRRGRPAGSKNIPKEPEVQPAAQSESSGPVDPKADPSPDVAEQEPSGSQAPPEPAQVTAPSRSSTLVEQPIAKTPPIDEVPNPSNQHEAKKAIHPLEACRSTVVPANFPQKTRAGKTLGEIQSSGPGGVAWIKWAANDFCAHMQASHIPVGPEATSLQNSARELVKLCSL